MRILPLSLLVALGCALPAQMSGSYTIDPNGSGPRNFKKLNDASAALAGQGVSGPVTITVASGTYAGTWFVPRVPGASQTNQILLEAATPRATTINGDARDSRSVEFVFGTTAFPVEWIVLDGFRLTGDVYAIEDQRYNAKANRNLEIRNCEFSGGSLQLFGSDHAVHHNVLRSGTRPSSLSLRADRSLVHHNIVQGGYVTVSGTYNSFGGSLWVYNNLIYGGKDSGLNAYFAYDSVIAHNTIVSTASGSYGVVTVSAHGLRPALIYGNVIYNSDSSTNAGSVIMDRSPLAPGIRSDGNLFFKASASGLFIDLGANGAYTSLSAWQLASGQDKNSAQSDPLFQNLGSGDLHLRQNSPAIDNAVGTPPYVTTDLDDAPRDKNPDIGCYELFIPFSLFGTGCPGALFNVPKMGSSGSPALGSSNFAFTLSNALGGAQGFFALGISNKTWGPIPLPIPFGGTCRILVSLDLISSIVVGGSGAGNGTASVKITIPNNPTLRGNHFYAQWAVVDAAAAQGLAFSDGALLTLR